MKIQTLAVIFVLIILPISIVLSEFVQTQINTLKIQTAYDSQLLSATYDAVVAFQKNTVNSWSSTITSSKMRDIEASANVFLTSIANNFKMSGTSKNGIKEYIPAIVYTLYDGYYIYTPFTNDLSGVNVTEDSTYQNGERIFGLKPYIFYSREYKDNGNEFVITYSLDNYITIQGKVDGKVINDGGYLIDLSKVVINNGMVTSYRGAEIRSGNADTVYEYVSKDKAYECVKVNGTKYYLNDENGKVFYFVKDERNYLISNSDSFKNIYFGENNKSAQQFYTNAYNFTRRIVRDYGLGGLTSSNGYHIFKTDDIEYYNSDFNQERRDVIKSSIEKNLATSIANFSNITNNTDTSINFQMPKLSEDEWDKIINNMSIITFLQGLNMGTRQYNGYAIVPNNKNEESVGEESIYIVANGEYHRVNDINLLNGSADELEQGIYNISFERKAVDKIDAYGNTVGTNYFYPRQETACYNCLVNQSDIDSLQKTLADGTNIPKSIYEYLDGNNTSVGRKLASLYYTALGRERNGLVKYGLKEKIEEYNP